MSEIYPQSMTDERKSNVLLQDGIFPSSEMNASVRHGKRACELSSHATAFSHASTCEWASFEANSLTCRAKTTHLWWVVFDILAKCYLLITWYSKFLLFCSFISAFILKIILFKFLMSSDKSFLSVISNNIL